MSKTVTIVTALQDCLKVKWHFILNTGGNRWYLLSTEDKQLLLSLLWLSRSICWLLWSCGPQARHTCVWGAGCERGRMSRKYIRMLEYTIRRSVVIVSGYVHHFTSACPWSQNGEHCVSVCTNTGVHCMGIDARAGAMGPWTGLCERTGSGVLTVRFWGP